jgi:peroxiredoxin Q/BCP
MTNSWKEKRRNVIRETIMELTMGMKAPTFSLLNQSEKKWNFNDYKGHWLVIYFYPKAMTSGCTVQACALRDIYQDLLSWNVTVVGISPDLPKKLQAFREKESLPFDLLSDPEHQIAEKYHAWGEKSLYGKKYMGILRKTFVVDPQGKIALVMPKVATKNHHEELAAFFQSVL